MTETAATPYEGLLQYMEAYYTSSEILDEHGVPGTAFGSSQEAADTVKYSVWHYLQTADTPVTFTTALYTAIGVFSDHLRDDPRLVADAIYWLQEDGWLTAAELPPTGFFNPFPGA